MSGVAGIVQWNGERASASVAGRMLAAIRHRGPDGLRLKVRDGAALGHALLRLQTDDERQPLCSRDGSLWIVADARLYNRASISARLGPDEWLAEHQSDAAYILACYERWESGATRFLHGDFAFAIWDFRRQRLFAARDHFGNKPFFYASSANGIVFGSEPKQLLMCPDVSAEPDDTIVGEYLFYKFEERDRTFLKGVRRLRPAHCLSAERGAVEQTRYWAADPQREFRYPTHQDYVERFRELLRDAVKTRVQVHRPVMAQLSGGMDSSSVVVLAADVYSRSSGPLPPLETVSHTFGDLPCDESGYIDAVCARVPFPSNRICALSEPLVDGLSEDVRRLDSPCADIQRAYFAKCAGLVADRRAGVLLTGLGGDELTHEEAYLRDLALRGRYISLLHDAWKGSRRSYNSFARLAGDGFRAMAPSPLRRIYRTHVAKRWQPPGWADPRLVRRFLESPEVEPDEPEGFRSLTQRMVYYYLSNPTTIWGLEILECQAGYHGFEVRHPFIDLPLVEYVLGIPFEHRMTGGTWKYLLHAGLASDLPPEVLQRRRKTHFQPYVNWVLFRDFDRLKELIFGDGRWESAGYVLREDARQLFANARRLESSAAMGDVMPVWAVATLELWLRRIARPGGQFGSESEMEGGMQLDNEGSAPTKKIYAKPTLERLGHMAVVTQKSGTTTDTGGTSFSQKPGGGQG